MNFDKLNAISKMLNTVDEQEQQTRKSVMSRRWFVRTLAGSIVSAAAVAVALRAMACEHNTCNPINTCIAADTCTPSNLCATSNTCNAGNTCSPSFNTCQTTNKCVGANACTHDNNCDTGNTCNINTCNGGNTCNSNNQCYTQNNCNGNIPRVWIQPEKTNMKLNRSLIGWVQRSSLTRSG